MWGACAQLREHVPHLPLGGSEGEVPALGRAVKREGYPQAVAAIRAAKHHPGRERAQDRLVVHTPRHGIKPEQGAVPAELRCLDRLSHRQLLA